MGVLYAVDTEGKGSYGLGCFRITAELRVENLPTDDGCAPAAEAAADGDSNSAG